MKYKKTMIMVFTVFGATTILGSSPNNKLPELSNTDDLYNYRFERLNESVDVEQNIKTYIVMFRSIVNETYGENKIKKLNPLEREKFIKELLPEEIYNKLNEIAQDALDNDDFITAGMILGEGLRAQSASDKFIKYMFTNNIQIQSDVIKNLTYMGVPGMSAITYDRLFSNELSFQEEYIFLYCLYSSDFKLFEKAVRRYFDNDQKSVEVKKLVIDSITNSDVGVEIAEKVIRKSFENNFLIKKDILKNKQDLLLLKKSFGILHKNWHNVNDKDFAINVAQSAYKIKDENIYIMPTFILMENSEENIKDSVRKYYLEGAVSEVQKNFFLNQFISKKEFSTE